MVLKLDEILASLLILRAQQVSVYGGDYNEPGLGEKKPAAKRKAPEVSADILQAVADVDYKVRANHLLHNA